ncbi:ribosome maturation factor RimP [Cellulomonas sp. JH27-2]|uniref:ribosome maturation factor RimP n=1 Tax=Cellulomonas sp. JH27-2 TaxID=2774139 RepID=UPI001784DE08|nr:ribosome maturation factor RimP [Cellulomonas sp. JH27-2]MBD8060547.1 ribosome maturation factor RimP [Cellulomonas sp. JH27-2]
MADAAAAGRVREVLAPVVEALGLVLEDVEVHRAGARSTVDVALDVPEDDETDLDLDRVADATRAISDALDARDVIAGHYTLEVGSRGLSRPLTERRHFARAVGRTVTVRLVDGGAIGGRLVDVDRDDDAIVVVPVTPGLKGRRPKEGEPVRITLTDVRDARVEVDLTGLGPVDDEAGASAGQES